MTCQRNDWSTHFRGRVLGVQVPGDALEELLPAVLELQHVRRVTVTGTIDADEYIAYETRLAEARPEITVEWLPEGLQLTLTSKP